MSSVESRKNLKLGWKEYPRWDVNYLLLEGGHLFVDGQKGCVKINKVQTSPVRVHYEVIGEGWSFTAGSAIVAGTGNVPNEFSERD